MSTVIDKLESCPAPYRSLIGFELTTLVHELFEEVINVFVECGNATCFANVNCD
jgi:hypothetical protein